MKCKVVIDVEMCKVSRANRRASYPYRNEIIQIGAVMLNDSFEELGRFSTYVAPEFGRIDNFIANLTDITDHDIKNAPSLEKALESMLLWFGDREVTFYAWSDSDYHQISKEIDAKGLDSGKMSIFMNTENWVDYQRIVTERFEFDHILKLSEALDLSEIDSEGRAHDGLNDAVNTANMLRKLELHPEFQCVVEMLHAHENESVSIGTSLGSLLEGFVL